MFIFVCVQQCLCGFFMLKLLILTIRTVYPGSISPIFPLAFLSSPKSKQEAMVRSPPVMSPSSAAQMDSKLPNQGKQGGTGSQSQPSPCDPKSLSGSHAPKGPQGSIGSMGLKNGQGLSSGNGAKGKIKRERSTSVESFEQRDTGTPNNEGDQKGKIKCDLDFFHMHFELSWFRALAS